MGMHIGGRNVTGLRIGGRDALGARLNGFAVWPDAFGSAPGPRPADNEPEEGRDPAARTGGQQELTGGNT